MFKNLDSWINRLRTQVERVIPNTIKSLERSLNLVEETSQGYTPLKTGQLRESFFTEIRMNPARLEGVAGYDKEGRMGYIAIMHRGIWPNDFWGGNLSHLNGTPIKYNLDTAPNAQPFFLAKGFLENQDEIYRILNSEAFNGWN